MLKYLLGKFKDKLLAQSSIYLLSSTKNSQYSPEDTKSKICGECYEISLRGKLLALGFFYLDW